jgi:signal peptidase I
MRNSLAEERQIPNHKRGLLRKFAYHGKSMQPTFQPGQLLYVCPEASDIAVGDVIIYQDLECKRNVVHRITAISPQGFITRGDNNPHNDPTPIAPHQIMGKVELIDQHDQISPITGGYCGLWATRASWLFRRSWNGFCRSFSRPYRWLRSHGWMRLIWRPRLITLYLLTDQEHLIKYLYHGHTIACWWPDQNRFECRKPFDLVLRKIDLPTEIP